MEYISHTYWGCYSEVAHLCKKEKVRVTFLISRDKNRRIDSHQVCFPQTFCLRQSTMPLISEPLTMVQTTPVYYQTSLCYLINSLNCYLNLMDLQMKDFDIHNSRLLFKAD